MIGLGKAESIVGHESGGKFQADEELIGRENGRPELAVGVIVARGKGDGLGSPGGVGDCESRGGGEVKFREGEIERLRTHGAEVVLPVRFVAGNVPTTGIMRRDLGFAGGCKEIAPLFSQVSGLPRLDLGG